MCHTIPYAAQCAIPHKRLREGFGKRRRIKARVTNKGSLACRRQLNTNMKNRIVLLAATAITALFVTQARAAYQPVGSDGIAASPKVRMMLAEQMPAAPTIQAHTMASCCQGPAVKTTTVSTKSCGSCWDKTAKQSQPLATK